MREMFGLSPYTEDMSGVADRRRLGCWSAARGVQLDTRTPESRSTVIINPLSDLARWARWREGLASRRLVFDFVDFRYVEEGLRRGISPTLASRSAGRNWLYSSGAHKLPWPTYGARIRRILDVADHVTCATPEQAELLAAYGVEATAILDCQEEIPSQAPRVEPEPTGTEESRPLRLLWEGQLATLGFLGEMKQGLKNLCEVAPVELIACTQKQGFRYANRFVRLTPESVLRPLSDIRGLRSVVTSWSPERLASEARRADVAVLPVSPEDSASWLKPENRAVIMWRLGLPVIMSGTPAFRRAALAAGAEGIVDDSGDWTTPLLKSADVGWRREQAARGHRYAMERVSPEVIHRQWDSVLERL